jgi:3-deoxy-D-manno-octulosonic-acid transferase
VLVPLGTLAVAPAWLLKSIRHPEYRAHLSERLGRMPADLVAQVDRLARRPVWVQAVSVGEVLVARTFMQAARDIPFVLSSTTPAGRDAAAAPGSFRLAGVCHFPIDWTPFMRRALDAIRPSALVCVETEIWPRLLSLCGWRGVPVLMINGRISERSHARYRHIRSLLDEGLSAVRVACMQTGQDAERAVSLGIPGDRVVVTGNLKFDAAEPAPLPPGIRDALALPAAGGPPVLVAGSTSEGEEDAVLEAVRLAGLDDLVLILAPRHRERFDAVASLLERRGVPFVRRSRLAPSVRRRAERIVLLDTLGELSRMYALATVAFVGGSLVPRGGQNMIEPAAHGVPVIFGPHTQHFDAVARGLLERGAATRVEDAAGLARALGRLVSDPEARAAAGRAGRALVEANRGAIGRTLERALPLLCG